MKRILIFSHEYPPRLGGAGSVAETLYNGISRYSDYEVTILTSSKTSLATNSKIIYIPFSRKFWPFSYSIWLAFNHFKFDTIIANDPAAIYVVGKYLNKKSMRKVVCFIHGEEKYLTSERWFVKAIGFKRAFLRAINYSKKVIFVSEFIKDFYSENYDIKTSREGNHRVIHSGICPVLFNSKTDVQRFHNRYLSVSRVEQKKGFDVMLASFVNLAGMGYDFEWLIAGDGSYLQEFQHKVNDSSISSKVTFLGKVERISLASLYSSSRFLISLSELSESYGLTYLEGASCGAIPIGYDRAGTSEAFSYIEGGQLIRSYKDPLLIAKSLSIIFDEATSAAYHVSCKRTTKDFCQEVMYEL